jgi:uncharacterized protein YciI
MNAPPPVERHPSPVPHRYFAYLYFMKPDPAAVGLVAPAHAAYWNDLQLPDYAGGPFSDHSGGLIIFGAADAADAQRSVDSDPFSIQGLVGEHWLKEWLPTPR